MNGRELMNLSTLGVGCKATDIDTTRSVFSKLANLEQGRVTVDWAWLENAPVNVTA